MGNEVSRQTMRDGGMAVHGTSPCHVVHTGLGVTWFTPATRSATRRQVRNAVRLFRPVRSALFVPPCCRVTVLQCYSATVALCTTGHPIELTNCARAQLTIMIRPPYLKRSLPRTYNDGDSVYYIGHGDTLGKAPSRSSSAALRAIRSGYPGTHSPRHGRHPHPPFAVNGLGRT